MVSSSFAADSKIPDGVFALELQDLYGLGEVDGLEQFEHSLLDLDSEDDSDSELTSFDIQNAVSDILVDKGMPQHRPTYCYDGDLLENLDGNSEDPTRRWDMLPTHVRDERWMTHFRMLSGDFERLLTLAGPWIPLTKKHNPAYREYSSKTKLLVTLYFLAHCPTLRTTASHFNIPPSSLSVSVIHPGLQAIRRALYENEDTKIVRFPSTVDEQQQTMAAFRQRFDLPGCIGAIDGSFIRMRKPTSTSNDAFWSFKGFVSTLLLAVCDDAGRFTYINAGAQGTLGDAGLFFQSNLRQQIESGLLEPGTFQLTAGGQTQQLSPYLVGDTAFGLTATMLNAMTEITRKTLRKASLIGESSIVAEVLSKLLVD